MQERTGVNELTLADRMKIYHRLLDEADSLSHLFSAPLSLTPAGTHRLLHAVWMFHGKIPVSQGKHVTSVGK